MNRNLSYIADCIIIEELARDPFNKRAQESFVASIAANIKEHVLSLWDPNHPAASIVAFMGPGILFKLGFPWLSIIYTVAEALGFDWKSFWASVGNGIATFVKSITSTKESNPSYQMPVDEASNKIKSIVEDNFNNHFTGEENKEKLLEIAKSQPSFKNDLRDALEVKAVALSLQKDPIIKEALFGTLFKGKLSGFFVRLISWVIKTALISLGFVSAAGVVGGLLGTTKKQDGQSSGESTLPPEAQKKPKLEMASNAPRSLFDVHRNETGSVWIEKGNIEDVEDYLSTWILSAYPQLSQDIGKLKASSAFQSMISKFRARNSLASGVGLIAIPKPFERKIDIVSTIVNGYLGA